MFFHSYFQLFPALYMCKNFSDQLSSIILYLLWCDGVFLSIKLDPSWIVFCLPLEHNFRRSSELCVTFLVNFLWPPYESGPGVCEVEWLRKSILYFQTNKEGWIRITWQWVTRFTSVCDELVVGVRGWGETACSFFCCIHMELSMSVPPRTCGISLASGIIASFLLSLTFHSAPFERTL